MQGQHLHMNSLLFFSIWSEVREIHWLFYSVSAQFYTALYHYHCHYHYAIYYFTFIIVTIFRKFLKEFNNVKCYCFAKI